MHEINKRIIYPCICLTGAVLVLFFPLLGTNTLFFRDIQLFFMPMKHFLAENWHQGHVPLWNPMQFCGTPFLADPQAGVFYPLSGLFYLLPFFYAFNTFVITHYVIAGWLTFALARVWRCSVFAAMLGALCFSLGGYLISTANVLNNLQAAIWLPAVFLCWEKSLGPHRVFYCLLTAVFLGIQFLAGEPELLLFTLVLLFAHHLTINCRGGRLRNLADTLARFLLIGVVSLLIVMIQWLPTWELLRHSVRSAGFTFQDAAVFSLSPLRLFDLLSPPQFDIYYHGNQPFSWLVSHYFGLAPLMLAIIAILYGRNRRTVFWGACLIISLLFALGKHTPLFLALYKVLPLFRAFRFPEKFFFISAYAIAFLTAFGLDVLRKKPKGADRLIGIIFGLLTCLFSGAWALNAVDCASAAPRFFLMLCTFALAVYCFLSHRLGGHSFCLLTLAVVAVDLVSSHQAFNPVIPKQFYEDPPTLAENVKKTPNLARIFVEADSYSGQIPPYALQHVWRNTLHPNVGTMLHLSYVNGLVGVESSYQWLITELLEKLKPDLQLRLLELSNTEYLVDGSLALPLRNALKTGRLEQIEYGLYRLPRALPRAYMVPTGKIAADRADAITEIMKDNFDPAKEVVLEKFSGPTPAGRGGTVTDVTCEGACQIRIRAHSVGGYLVLLEAFYPGWQVFDQGVEKTVLRANGLFTGVYLEPGIHEVLFKYEPKSFLWGKRMSGVAVPLLLLGLWIWRPVSENLDPSDAD